MSEKIKVGLYGQNGHQVNGKLYRHKNAEIVAISGVTEAYAEEILKNHGENVKIYVSLDEMLKNDEIDLISLCSPERCNQAEDAIKCLKAGKHVYAEKPAAFSIKELDKILDVSKKTGYEFHEMADSVFVEPYFTARKLVRNGKIGEVVQVYVQKSYPLNVNSRPQNEEKDGGLIRQAGIHAIRFLEHITGLYVDKVNVFQTHKGNIDEEKGLFTASSWAMTLSNGGVASACINYLNPKGFIKRGNESVRIFGTKGMLEITDGATKTHIYTENGDEGEIDVTNSKCEDFLDLYIKHLLLGSKMPMSEEEELHPLKVVIKAFEDAKTTKG